MVTANFNGGTAATAVSGRVHAGFAAQGEGGVFDRVIIATQASHLDFLDDTQFGDEREMLENIGFDSGELWVHQVEPTLRGSAPVFQTWNPPVAWPL